MSLNKAIQHGKEYRKSYHGSKAIDKTTRNHGDDYWSEEDRLIQSHRELEKAKHKLKEYKNEDKEYRKDKKWR